jgi:hypothetical protein
MKYNIDFNKTGVTVNIQAYHLHIIRETIEATKHPVRMHTDLVNPDFTSSLPTLPLNQSLNNCLTSPVQTDTGGTRNIPSPPFLSTRLLNPFNLLIS